MVEKLKKTFSGYQSTIVWTVMVACGGYLTSSWAQGIEDAVKAIPVLRLESALQKQEIDTLKEKIGDIYTVLLDIRKDVKSMQGRNYGFRPQQD